MHACTRRNLLRNILGAFIAAMMLVILSSIIWLLPAIREYRNWRLCTEFYANETKYIREVQETVSSRRSPDVVVPNHGQLIGTLRDGTRVVMLPFNDGGGYLYTFRLLTRSDLNEANDIIIAGKDAGSMQDLYVARALHHGWYYVERDTS